MDEFVCSCCGVAMHSDSASYPAVDDTFVDPYAVTYAEWGATDITWADPYAVEVPPDLGVVEPVYVEEFYVEPGDGFQSYVEPAYAEPSLVEQSPTEPAFVEPAFVEPAFVEPAFVEPAANFATIGGFDLNGGITVVEPVPVVQDPATPTGNEITIGGFDLNGGITVVLPAAAEPAWIPQVGNVTTIGGFDINGGITVAEPGAAPLPANQLSIGGPPLPEFDVSAVAWGQETWDLVLSAGRNVQADPIGERVVGDTIAMTAIRSIDVTSSNAMFNSVNWGPSSGTSYNYEHRLQNNPYGTSY